MFFFVFFLGGDVFLLEKNCAFWVVDVVLLMFASKRKTLAKTPLFKVVGPILMVLEVILMVIASML